MFLSEAFGTQHMDSIWHCLRVDEHVERKDDFFKPVAL
jgi:hypothetical protein